MINNLYDWLLEKYRPISFETQGHDAPSSSAAFVDLLESRVHAANMEMMRQMQDDMDQNSAMCLVLPLYNDLDGPRHYLRLVTIIDGTKTETPLNGSYKTYKSALKAANFIEAAARVILRQLRPPSMDGAEQAIFPRGEHGVVTPP